MKIGYYHISTDDHDQETGLQVDALNRAGFTFVPLNERIDTDTAGGRMFYAMLAAFAEYEADTIAACTMAGLQAAKRRGVRLGRPTPSL